MVYQIINDIWYKWYWINSKMKEFEIVLIKKCLSNHGTNTADPTLSYYRHSYYTLFAKYKENGFTRRSWFWSWRPKRSSGTIRYGLSNKIRVHSENKLISKVFQAIWHHMTNRNFPQLSVIDWISVIKYESYYMTHIQWVKDHK